MTRDPHEDEEYVRLMLEVEELEQRSADHARADMLSLERTMCEKFRILREERAWSQKELADRMRAYGFDFHQSTIAKLEAGTRPLRVAEMYAFAQVFKLPPGAIFFMAYSEEKLGMGALAGRINGLVEQMETFKTNTLQVLDNYIWMMADDQRRLNSLVDLMRQVARDDPSNADAQRLIKEHDWRRADSTPEWPRPGETSG